jgi:hypothetical protein
MGKVLIIVKIHNESYIREAYIIYGPKEDVGFMNPE